MKGGLMLAKSLLLTFLATVMGSAALAAGYSASTHYYEIEYVKPSAGTGDVSVLNITFNRQLDAQTAERILREELQRAVTLFPPKGEVMAYAWTETSSTLGSEKMISLPDSSKFLIYSPKTKQMQTEKQYDISRQKPAQPGKGLNIELSLELERGADGRARILGKTNLPDGMILMLGLRDTSSTYSAQDKAEVISGRIVSSWFSEHSKPLHLGTYEIKVSSPLRSLQPPAVRAIIGQTGENLVGPIQTMMGSKMVEYRVKKTLK